jgi:hypothetical protein
MMTVHSGWRRHDQPSFFSGAPKGHRQESQKREYINSERVFAGARGCGFGRTISNVFELVPEWSANRKSGFIVEGFFRKISRRNSSQKCQMVDRQSADGSVPAPRIPGVIPHTAGTLCLFVESCFAVDLGMCSFTCQKPVYRS